MVHSCAAYNCVERAHPSTAIAFHRFPKDPKLEASWIRAMKRKDWVPKSHSRICSKHFAENAYSEETTLRGGKILKKNAVPSIFDFPAHLQKSSPFADVSNSHGNREKFHLKKKGFKENLTAVTEETPSKVPRLSSTRHVLTEISVPQISMPSSQPVPCALDLFSKNYDKEILSSHDFEGSAEVDEMSLLVPGTPHDLTATLQRPVAAKRLCKEPVKTESSFPSKH